MRIFNRFKNTRGFILLHERVLRFRYMITEQAQQRVRILAFWEKHGYSATTEAFHVSRRTLYRWQTALRERHGKLEGLNPRNTVPLNRRKRVVPMEVTDRIIALRTIHRRLGKDKIHAILAREGYPGSVSTIGRILGDLKKRGALSAPKTLSFNARTGKFTERKPIKRKKKLRRPHGYRVLEVDTIVRYIDGAKRYILTAIDTETRTAFAATYTNHGSASAADFLCKCVQAIPDCPSALQTDNGSEFARHFEQALRELGMTHFHTYPRSPKMNAHVERFNRTLDEEFLSFHRGLLRDDVSAFNEKLMDWLLWYNAERPHHALSLRSPFRAMMEALPASECHMWWTDTRIGQCVKSLV